METFAKYQDSILQEWKTYGIQKIYDISTKTSTLDKPDHGDKVDKLDNQSDSDIYKN